LACRTQYASVCGGGDWVRPRISHGDRLSASRPAMTGEGQARLGELRRCGRFAEAADLFDEAGPSDRGWPTRSRSRRSRKAIDLADLRSPHRAAPSARARSSCSPARVAGAAGRRRAPRRSRRREPRGAVRTCASAAVAPRGDGRPRRRGGAPPLRGRADLFEQCGAPFNARARLDLARAVRPGRLRARRTKCARRARSIDAAYELGQARALAREPRARGRGCAVKNDAPTPARTAPASRGASRKGVSSPAGSATTASGASSSAATPCTGTRRKHFRQPMSAPDRPSSPGVGPRLVEAARGA
jgi:hypothetical protein